MASATWTPSTNGNAAAWSKDKTLSDLQAAATMYNDATVTYNSLLVYYDGYNPTGTTPEGVPGSIWAEVAE